RGGPTTSDEILHAQLSVALQAVRDRMVIDALIAAVSSPVTSATWTDMSTLLLDVNEVASNIETAAGVHLTPNALFVPVPTWRWLSSQVDSSKRPILVPTEPIGAYGLGDTGVRLGGG